MKVIVFASNEEFPLRDALKKRAGEDFGGEAHIVVRNPDYYKDTEHEPAAAIYLGPEAHRDPVAEAYEAQEKPSRCKVFRVGLGPSSPAELPAAEAVEGEPAKKKKS